MKTIIVDDEANCSELIHNLLGKYCPQVEVAATCTSVQEGYEAIRLLHPDLVFLDVQMPDGNGFDLLNRFSDIDFKIIFATAHQQFAIDALKRSAIDYLLKPVSPPELIGAVNKAGQMLNGDDWNNQIKTLLGNLAEPLQRKQRIVLKTMERIYSLHLNEIIRLQSEGSYTEVYLKDGRKIVVSRLLKEFDELLAASGFLRVHQSHLVNVDHIFYFDKIQSIIAMKDETQVPVSVRKRDGLMELLNSY
jgi:two-component system LytT family response regulator